ncbi:MAG: hypothetical protein HOP13_11640 [Alphaproteobacteria bacterium]|nr:hypothetical protein [Alphaproteobacteria bacterium]
MQRIRALFAEYFTPISAATVGIVVAILIVCILLWEVPWLRPYLAAFGAGAAAFLGPLSGIISPEARTKWLASILIAGLIAVFTWLAAADLDARLDASETRNASYLRAFEKVLKESNGEAQDSVLMAAGGVCRHLYREKQPQAVLDLALLILSVRPNNGHGLYFAAEAHRDMRDAGGAIGRLQNYIAQTGHEPDAFVGDAAACYARANGFCAERTGWALHLMANHFVNDAASLAGDARQQLLWDAFKQEKRNVELVKWDRKEEKDELADLGQPFRLQGTVRSSCEILRIVERELAALGQDVSDIRRERLRLLAKSCRTLATTRAR